MYFTDSVKYEVCFVLTFQMGHKHWSALATTPASTSALAGAKEAINLIETWLCLLLLFVSNHKTTTSKQHRKLKFGMQSYFNPTRKKMEKIPNYRTSKVHSKLKFGMQSYLNPTKRNIKKKKLGHPPSTSHPNTGQHMYC